MIGNGGTAEKKLIGVSSIRSTLGSNDVTSSDRVREITRMIRKLDLQNREEVFRLLDIQSASYIVEARLIGFYDIPPLNDTFDTLRQSEETFYGYFMENQLAGAISFKRDDDVLDIHRLMVHPAHFRKGIAGSLLTFVERMGDGIRHLVVMTGAKNVPAKKLYKKHGFIEGGRKEIVPGVPMTSFKKSLI